MTTDDREHDREATYHMHDMHNTHNTHNTHDTQRDARRSRALWLAPAVALLAFGCQSVPELDARADPGLRQLRAESPIDWSSRASACTHARSQARRTALRQCEVAQLSHVSDSCECRRGEAHLGSWSCSASVAFVCREDQVATTTSR